MLGSGQELDEDLIRSCTEATRSTAVGHQVARLTSLTCFTVRKFTPISPGLCHVV